MRVSAIYHTVAWHPTDWRCRSSSVMASRGRGLAGYRYRVGYGGRIA